MSEYLEAIEQLDCLSLKQQLEIVEQVFDETGCDCEYLALALEAETLEVSWLHGNTYLADGERWLVVDDSDADSELDDELERLLDEPGMVEGADTPYFDRDKWKRDAEHDGRGHYLAGYDGEEREQGSLFLYKIG
jgi:hypothetical protein